METAMLQVIEALKAMAATDTIRATANVRGY